MISGKHGSQVVSDTSGIQAVCFQVAHLKGTGMREEIGNGTTEIKTLSDIKNLR